MPIFEYKCRECGAVSELLVFSSDKEPPQCKKCASENLEKIHSSFSAKVKSSGLGCGYDDCQSGNCMEGGHTCGANCPLH